MAALFPNQTEILIKMAPKLKDGGSVSKPNIFFIIVQEKEEVAINLPPIITATPASFSKNGKKNNKE
jgi:hypothetical protein